jgi:hypothetical protein
MMMDPRVKKLFLAMQQDLREQFKDARKDNILKLLILSEYDPADAFGDDNVILPMKQIPAECRVAIKKYRYRPDGSYEVDFIDRVAVIRLLMEAFGDVDSKVNAVGGIAQVHFHGRVLR